jgi:hypothetical protein
VSVEFARYREWQMTRRLLTSVALAVLTVVAFTASPARAFKGYDVTTYSSWHIGSTDISLLDAPLRVTADPGTVASYFYASQFVLTNGDVGYIGLQTDGGGTGGKIAIVSFWNALSATPGPSAAWCSAFGNEGVGQTCRMRLNWVAGHTYRMRVSHLGSNRWGAWAYDQTTGANYKLGEIVARAGRVGPDVTNFVEYYGTDFPDCTSLPYSTVRFYRPSANLDIFGTNTGRWIGPGACSNLRTTTAGSDYVEHRIGSTSVTCGFLFTGRSLARGQSITSCGGRYRLAHQTDGNVVLYDQSTGVAVWNTGTWGRPSSTFVMQKDGNLVLYFTNGSQPWATWTQGKPGAFLKVQTDAKLVIYRADESGWLWASR